MNYIKRAYYSICYRKVKVILMIIMFSATFTVVISGLMMFTTSNKIIENLKKSVANSITLKPILIIDKSKGAYMYYTVDPTDMSTFSDSKYVDKYNYYSGDHVEFINIKKYIGDEKKYNEMLNKRKNHDYFYDGSIYALIDSTYDVAFTVNGYELIEGRHITEKDSGKKVCLISQELAELNQLKLGDVIQVKSNIYNSMEYSLTIIGFFSTPVGEYLTGTGSSPSEIIFMPNGTLNSYLTGNGLKNAQIINGCVYLKKLSDLNDFIEEIKNKLNIRNVQDSHFGNNLGEIPDEFAGWDPQKVVDYYIKNHYYDLQIDREWYEMVALPIENVNRMNGILVEGIIIGATAIVILLNVLSLKGRKREIGVLLAMGEIKYKVIGQFLLEEFIPIFIAASIGLYIGTTSGVSFIKGFSDMVYNQKEEEVFDNNQQAIHSYMQEYENLGDYGWNHHGAGDLNQKRSSRIIIQDKVTPKMDITTIITYMAATFGLIFLVLVIQIFSIVRLKPTLILTGKN